MELLIKDYIIKNIFDNEELFHIIYLIIPLYNNF
jgi:hypothetical protein